MSSNNRVNSFWLIWHDLNAAYTDFSFYQPTDREGVPDWEHMERNIDKMSFAAKEKIAALS